jgi:hypothetical protein
MKRVRKFFTFLLLMVSILMSDLQIAFADSSSSSGGSLGASKLVTGSKKLLEDATFTLLIVIPFIAVVLILWEIIKSHNASDEGEVKPIKKKIFRILLGTGIAFTIDGIVHIIVSYYQ